MAVQKKYTCALTVMKTRRELVGKSILTFPQIALRGAPRGTTMSFRKVTFSVESPSSEALLRIQT